MIRGVGVDVLPPLAGLREVKRIVLATAVWLYTDPADTSISTVNANCNVIFFIMVVLNNY
jgi:hypothetical protein